MRDKQVFYGVCVFAALAVMLVCIQVSVGDSVDSVDYTADYARIYPHETRPLSALEQETFALLKSEFPGEALDEGLETLHAIAESAVYKAFLEKKYPDASVPDGLMGGSVDLPDDTLYRLVPPKSRYIAYYKQHFGVSDVDSVMDAEHFLIHREMMDTWVFGAAKRARDLPMDKRQTFKLSSGKPFRLPEFVEMMQRRFGVDMPAGLAVYVSDIGMPISGLTNLHLKADAEWIAGLFEAHGRSDAIFWIALQDPALLSRIRYAFTTENKFLKFVEDPGPDLKVWLEEGAPLLR